MQERGHDDQQPQDRPGWQDPNQSGGWQQAPYGGQQPQWAQQPGAAPQYGEQPPQTGWQQQARSGQYAGYRQPQPPKRTGRKIAGFGCLGAIVVAVIVVIAAVAAGSKDDTGVNTTAAGSSGTAAAKASNAAAPGKPAGLGATIDVTDATGNQLAVTLEKVDAKAVATDGFSEPDAGDQYYAAQFEIKDVGSGAWSDAPSNCTVVKDGSGQTFESAIVQSISSGPLMADTANLAVGDSVLGWIVFEVPKGDTVTTIQFTPDSGMADSTAQWSLA